EGDFRNQNDRLPILLQGLVDRLQVYLGFAAPRHSVQQDSMMPIIPHWTDDGLKGLILSRGEGKRVCPLKGSSLKGVSEFLPLLHAEQPLFHQAVHRGSAHPEGCEQPREGDRLRMLEEMLHDLPLARRL